MNTRNALLVLAVALLAAACGQGSEIIVPDAGTSLDGISTMGSGNAASTSTSPTDSTMTASGIGTMGSGN